MLGAKLFKQFSVLVLCFFALACQVQVLGQDEDSSSDEQVAKVLLYKYSDTNPVVEGKEFAITYQLVNIGNAAATHIEVGDRYDPNSFETISNLDAEGIVSKEFEELAPGAQVSFNVTVRPKLFGMYESTRARLKYSFGVPMDDVEPEFKHGYSTSLGRTRIISTVEDARNNNNFAKEWITFAAIYAIPTVIPLLLWNQSKRTKKH